MRWLQRERLKATRELISLLRDEGKEAVLFVMGRKGVGFFNFRGLTVEDSWTGFSESPKYSDASTATGFLVDLFVAGSGVEVERPGGGDGSLEGVDELHLVYTRFQSMLSQVPEVRRVAPLVVSEDTDSSDDKPSRNYTFEPGAETLLDALLPKYVTTRVYAALLDSAASESAARRTAMKAATDNAEELAKTLSREATSSARLRSPRKSARSSAVRAPWRTSRMRRPSTTTRPNTSIKRK